MKREIKFRGLRTDGKGWVYGTYMEFNDRIYFCNWAYGPDFHELEESDFIEAIPESIGQYTGFKDKYSVDIYEGDILMTDGEKTDLRTILDMREDLSGQGLENGEEHRFEVIGNIHQK